MKRKKKMKTYDTNMVKDINIGSFVLVDGEEYEVVSTIDEDGFFFATDSDGEDYEFHFEHVENVTMTLKLAESNFKWESCFIK